MPGLFDQLTAQAGVPTRSFNFGMDGMFPPEERRHVEQAHAAIARAMLKGEAAAVERLMRKHMQEYVDTAAVSQAHTVGD